MNLQIRNKKQLLLFLITIAFVIGFLAIILFFNFSNNKASSGDNTSIEQLTSITSSTSTTEQVPERITDLLSSLPYQSAEFDVFYEDKKLKIYSRTLEGDTLKNTFLTWIARIPNFAISKYTVEYYDAKYMLDLKLKALNSSNSQLTK